MREQDYFGRIFHGKAGIVARSALSLVDSFPCVYCSKHVPEGSGTMCEECMGNMPFVIEPRCPGCGAENDGIFDLCGKCLKEDTRPWLVATALMRMEGAGRELIHRLKYGRDTSVARFLGEKAAGAWKTPALVDVVVPVPLHWTRLIVRGFNQSELIAQIFSKNSGISLIRLLRRCHMTRKQANLDRESRRSNLVGAFEVCGVCEGLRVLLVDDVLTTGATLTSASETLLNAGAKEVNILVAARA
ncbi:MAG: ComF family protein [Victivallales bacterium]|nr:ComF family protein [Victivallales bacterium]